MYLKKSEELKALISNDMESKTKNNVISVDITDISILK
jgi:hypothetical protein